MAKPKKIALFIPSLNTGGVEKVFVSLANSLSVRGYDVDLVVNTRRGELLGDVNPKIKIIELKGRKLRNCLPALLKYITNTPGITLISGPTYPNLLAIVGKLLSFRKIKVIATHHNFQDIEMEGLGLKGRLMPFLIRTLYKYADSVVAVSDSLKRSLTDNMGLANKLVHRIYNPVIDNDFFKRAEAYNSAELLPLGFEKYIISVGRLEKIKNNLGLLRAFFQSNIYKKGFKLVIVGDGEDRQSLENEASILNLEEYVHFTGTVNNPLPLIKNARLLMQTSFSESFSLVIVEALALRTPIIATATQGAVEVLQAGEYGILVPLNDSMALTNNLKHVETVKTKAPSLNYLNVYRDNIICDEYLKLI